MTIPAGLLRPNLPHFPKEPTVADPIRIGEATVKVRLDWSEALTDIETLVAMAKAAQAREVSASAPAPAEPSAPTALTIVLDNNAEIGLSNTENPDKAVRIFTRDRDGDATIIYISREDARRMAATLIAIDGIFS